MLASSLGPSVAGGALDGGQGLDGAVSVPAATATAPATATLLFETGSVDTGNIGYINTQQDRQSALGPSMKELLKRQNLSVLAMVEVHGAAQRDSLKRSVCDLIEYNCFMAPYTKGGSSPASYPIVWDTSKYAQVGEGKIYHMTDAYTNAKGDNISSRYLLEIELKNRASGEEVIILWSHAPSGAQDPDGSINKSAGAEKLREFSDKEAAVLEKLKEQNPEAAIVYMKDGNVDKKTAGAEAAGLVEGRLKALGFQDPYDSMPSGELPIAHTRATGQKVTIDYAFTNDKLANTTLNVPSSMFGGDHHAVVVSGKFAVPPGSAHPEVP